MSSRIAGAALVIVISLALAGCGGEGNDDGKKTIDLNAARGSGPDGTAPKSSEAPASSSGGAKLGEIKGPDGVVVTLTSAVRDKGGFVTVNGTVANRGSKPYTPLTWRSKETEMKSQSSVSGASLIDSAGKKRYLVLRDTDGECLCTTGLVNIRPGESRPVFAQFPAPPASVTDVDFQLPAMPSARIRISG
ncbi:hypothetical protein [Streptomyces abikoensis]|uniref:hypothetical protein n=1 Tax=Streptomyces abikoensis TaxID=97398 RepID=UPI001677EBF2|nr:hypothetical protein [Streptomyces abikoensis]GGP53221.1 hypothetical protein GCM10010214_28040 [Streptomyces abikoensis]